MYTSIGHNSKKKPNQNQKLETDKKPNQFRNITIQNQTTENLKIELKPPKLFHVKKPLLTSTNGELNIETSVSEIVETKPTEETKPSETKPSVEGTRQKPNTLQYMMNKAKPEAKTKPASTHGQQGKPKQKVVETNQLKLFLEKKKRERDMKGTGVVIENIVITTNQNISPKNHSVRATLPQTNTLPTQSAPRASNLQAQRLPDFSTTNQGDQKASASNEGYQI